MRRPRGPDSRCARRWGLVCLVALLALGTDLVYDSFFEEVGGAPGVAFAGSDPDDTAIVLRRPIEAHATLFFRSDLPAAATPRLRPRPVVAAPITHPTPQPSLRRTPKIPGRSSGLPRAQLGNGTPAGGSAVPSLPDQSQPKHR
jgi:hypothetical protein